MAGNVQISVKDEDSARRWLASVQAINEDYSATMQEVAQAISDLRDCAEGNLIDEFYFLSRDLLRAGMSVYDEMEQLVDTVNEILGTIHAFVDQSRETIRSVISRIFGK